MPNILEREVTSIDVMFVVYFIFVGVFASLRGEFHLAVAYVIVLSTFSLYWHQRERCNKARAIINYFSDTVPEVRSLLQEAQDKINKEKKQ